MSGTAHRQPLVSALMVTRNRLRLAERAVRCFEAQTWPNRELVVVDDGHVPYEEMLEPFQERGLAIRYIRPGGVRRSLGELRNLANDHARGDWRIQWDDDEWYHPDRIVAQVAAAERSGVPAVVLRWTLMQLDATDGDGGPVFRADSGFATPGTIAHRPTGLRYPDARRGEDSVFLNELRHAGRVLVLGKQWSHLFVRCHHGANTWGRDHFERRLHRRWTQWPDWVRVRLSGDLTSHRAFRLRPDEQATVAAMRADARAHPWFEDRTGGIGTGAADGTDPWGRPEGPTR